ncbi:MAG: AAA family ATPase, partial [Sulfurovum sp.]
MQLQLKNIGMIKEANVSIEGLTVIAGENDTGKSTLSKALYVLIKEHHNIFGKEGDGYYLDVYRRIFKEEFSPKVSEINLNLDLGGNVSFGSFSGIIEEVKNIIFVETPLVWNFSDFFRDIAQIESQMRIELDYPYLMKDLNFKLHIKNASSGIDIKKKMTDLMGGEFKKDEMGRYYFDKQGQRIELVNTATGIKYFGLFQILSQNNYLNRDSILILDEPEVHLHPKWQLEMAKIIVELVSKGVNVVVNSHSPYMIEALERYGETSKIFMDFYLAEDGYIDKVEDDNSKTGLFSRI